jgi:hypothetical protein
MINFSVTIKSAEAYLSDFPIQKEEVDTVIRLPTFTKCYKVTTAVKINLIAVDDDRSPAGKVHLFL